MMRPPLSPRRTAARNTSADPHVLPALLDARRTYRAGPAAVAERQRARLADLIAFTRTRSPFYRQLYAGLPERIEDPSLLPVTTKRELMARFDEIVTDHRVTRQAVEAFVADSTLIGQPFLNANTVATTSGTTGIRGMFLIDQQALVVATAMAGRMLASWLRPRDVFRIVAGRGRTAMVSATGGHFASVAAAARLRNTRRGARTVRLFSVQTPLTQLVAELNSFRPALLAPYASTAVLLASEQQAGRLHINPVLVTLSAEGLAPDERRRIADAFGATVGNSYAATECPFLSFSCRQGWLHVNSDWAILEPVDADHRPVPPGRQSHTVLLTNLANRVQPILRYDLGDSVLTRSDPCACGNPLPAIQVQGRAADVLTLPDAHGSPVTITPLTLSALLDRIPGVELAQIAQTAPTALSVRLRPAAGADREQVWRSLATEIDRLLRAHGLDVALHLDGAPPQPTGGGKYRLVQPLRSTEVTES
ncbi:Putative coenzyme F390 synthetase [Modestobacter italicus]|uniref:Coenzyme F390 synthetase n=2 Tax=Modestobacter italicus (strain DSM 44449 / CECT 9708 / BC 501) TaxID=2732864 RepID=I4EUN5_MODI5|nr:Putative coenzyme F390 synthetase [Modestobacter marinus]